VTDPATHPLPDPGRDPAAAMHRDPAAMHPDPAADQRPDAAAGPALTQRPTESRRLHPLTPFARGWAAMVAAAVFFGQDALRTLDPVRILLTLVAVAVVGSAYGLLSWWFTRYVIERDDLRVDSGVLFRRTRHVRLNRLQAIDVVRPLVARFLGLAELRLEVAGGSDSEGRLAYLSEPDAQRLRAELLARAAGVRPDTPEAPERVLHHVPAGRVVASIALSTWLVVAVTVAVVGLVVAAVLRQPAVLFPLGAVVFGVIPAVWREFSLGFDFTVAESPDGLRLRHGLTEHRSQTVPPGRVQALRIVEPFLWRRQGWARVEVNVAGYAGGGNEAAARTSVLMPVAPRADALAIVARILPGVAVDAVPLHPVPRRARWRAPVTWRVLACGADAAVFVARRGLLRRELDVILHGKTQSVRLTQGPWQRRLGLATVHLDTTPGPVHVHAAHRDAVEARQIVEAQAERARAGRLAAGPERWMRPPPPKDVRSGA
jgi:putative membrane protein